jgi:hypothetical protein
MDDYRAEPTKFICDDCERCIYDGPIVWQWAPSVFDRIRLCVICVRRRRAEQAVLLGKMPVGNRFRLMFGQPLLSEQSAESTHATA